MDFSQIQKINSLKIAVPDQIYQSGNSYFYGLQERNLAVFPYTVIKRMMKEGRGNSKIFFSDGENIHPINIISCDDELNSDITLYHN